MNSTKVPPGTAKIKPKRKRRLPPGQRLLLFALAGAGLSLLPGISLPVEISGHHQAVVAPACPVVQVPPFKLDTPLTDVQKEIEERAKKPGLYAGVFVVEPKTGRYIDVNGKDTFAAASMIKLPVLVALMIALDKHQVDLAQKLTLRSDLIAGGSGYLQWRPPGSKIALQEVMDLMITHSDNTATNMIIDLLGGIPVLNSDFAKWGLNKTHINAWLPDFEGTNTTDPYELSFLLGRLDSGQLVSEASRKLMYSIMERTTVRSLLPPGLRPGTKIAHKTGDIASMVGDAGIITAFNGVRYIAVVQVTRSTNDRRANQLIREISNVIYQGLTGDAYVPPVEPSVGVRHHGRHRHHRSHRHS